MAKSYAYLCKRAGHLPPRGLAHIEKKARTEKPQIYATFHMPVLVALDDEAATQIVRLDFWTDRDFVQEMADNYAALHAGDPKQGLPTFFPNHP